MVIALNIEHTKSLSNFFSNMAVAWFVAAFIGPPAISAIIVFVGYGIMALYISLLLLRGGT